MDTVAFIMPVSVLNDKVPDNFLEPNGNIFRDYLHTWHEKDGKILFPVCRYGVFYDAWEEEVKIWSNYFGAENEVSYQNELPNFVEQKPTSDENE